MMISNHLYFKGKIRRSTNGLIFAIGMDMFVGWIFIYKLNVHNLNELYYDVPEGPTGSFLRIFLGVLIFILLLFPIIMGTEYVIDVKREMLPDYPGNIYRKENREKLKCNVFEDNLSNFTLQQSVQRVEIAQQEHFILYFIALLTYLFFVILLLLGVLPPYKDIGLALSSIAFIMFFIFQPLGVIRILCELFPIKKVVALDSGIKIPYTIKIWKDMSEPIIKYEWITLVVLNDWSNTSLWAHIFFEKDGMEYVCSCFQTRIKDELNFISVLKKRGIDTHILFPAINLQKKMKCSTFIAALKSTRLFIGNRMWLYFWR